ncbi:competence protein ComEA [Thermosyntropha lipolytica DSM 11003]|uniref:Competence protein ComEA n=1 Tax=Thermosyntropha lipolytica DSM 11003 TaxID=1123382 RepID=A0A1M5N5V5_9FIRM|nr:ComEA family DNA-binding protein [Thermosyntropha lipolytica]SHG84960.1 competence protein ComEA [Thermosyntropha lipolytica DSM 11003]
MFSLDKKTLALMLFSLLLAFYAGVKYAGFIQSGKPAATIFLDGGESLTANAEKEEEGNMYIEVYVGGQVEKPGVYRLPKGARVYQAVEQAGGITDRADLKYVPLARILEDEETIWIPSPEEVTGLDSSYVSTFYTSGGNNAGKVNINTASAEELAAKLNGIGPQLAKRIVDYRNQNGKFKSIDEIKNVSGIGEKRFEQIKDQICVR